MKLSGNTVLITGGTSGVGYELAAQLLKRDNVVIVTGREQATLERTQRSLRGVHCIKSDVNDPDEIQRDRLELRPGLSNVLRLMSRVAPQFMLNRLSRSVES